MDVVEAIKGRRSVRAYKNVDVTEETVAKLIDAARWAPSAGNIQPWLFIEEAPVVIVVCADETRSSEGYSERGKALYCIQDTAAAIQNIHLIAYSLGLGTCWVGAFKEEEASEALNLPSGVRPVALIPIGHYSKAPSPRARREVDEIVHYDGFQEEK